MNILLYDLGSTRQEYNEPLSIEVIAGQLIDIFPNHNVDLKWVNSGAASLDSEELKKYRIIGISLNLGTLDRFKTIYGIVQNFNNPPLLVVGNVIPTFAYESILKTYKGIICVRGEGEVAFLKIVQGVTENNFNLEARLEIPNLVFIDNDRLYKTKRSCTNLSDIKLPLRQFSNWIKSNKGIARIEGSRGCAWGHCKFCCVKEKYGDSTWRPLPISYIVEDLVRLSRLGLLSPYFTDEDFFGISYRRAEELADAITSAKNMGRISNEMNFFISASAKDIASQECHLALEKWREAGLREVFVGIEAGSKKQLQRFGKGNNADINIKAIEILCSMGFEIDIGYILFEPFQTFDELQINVNYLKKLDAYSYNARPFKKLRIQPLTPLRADCDSVITGGLNVDDLSFPYEFIDANVKKVYCLFDAWEGKNKQDIYSLQASTRGETTYSLEKQELKNVLESIRKIDLLVLEIIIDYVSQKVSAFDYLEATNFYQKKRDLLVSCGLQIKE